MGNKLLKKIQFFLKLPASWTELPACTVFLPSEPALTKKALGILLGCGTNGTDPSVSSLTYHSGSILTNPNSPFWTNKLQDLKVLIWKNKKSFFAWDQTNQGPGAGTSVYVNWLPSGLENVLCLSMEYWTLCFPGWSWNTKDKTPSWQSRQEWSR